MNTYVLNVHVYMYMYMNTYTYTQWSTVQCTFVDTVCWSHTIHYGHRIHVQYFTNSNLWEITVHISLYDIVCFVINRSICTCTWCRLTDSLHTCKYALRNICCRTNQYSRFFIPSNVELWNSLDNMILYVSENLNSFKSRVNTFLLSRLP